MKGGAFGKFSQEKERCEQDSESHALPLPAKLGRLLKIAMLKFLLHSTSYPWFPVFLLGQSLVMETQLSTFHVHSQSVWETSLHMVWVTGTCVGPSICGSPPWESPSPFFMISTPLCVGGSPAPVDALEHTSRPLWTLAHQATFSLSP